VKTPPLSVVMPVRNAEPYLTDSITSILNQTVSDFEFVILDDASTDRSRAIIRDWANRDPRIRPVFSDRPLGPAGSADRVVREARAPLCARMDADDLSDPERLSRELSALERRPDASLVGTLWVGIDRHGQVVRPRDRWRLYRGSVFAPFPHGSMMFRREWFLGLGGYREACTYWEDLDFYLRMAERGPILVLTDALYRYRFHTEATTALSSQRHLRAVELMYRCTDRVRAGQDYSALLESSAEGNGHIDPRVLRSLGSPRLWSGQRPLPPGALRHVRLQPSRAWLAAGVMASWGAVSPRSLRLALRTVIRGRDAIAGWRVRPGTAVEWRPRDFAHPSAENGTRMPESKGASDDR